MLAQLLFGPVQVALGSLPGRGAYTVAARPSSSNRERRVAFYFYFECVHLVLQVICAGGLLKTKVSVTTI